MYFSVVRIPSGSDYFDFLKDSDFRNMYHAHQLLWKLFPHNPDAERDFLFREQREHNRIYYYLVSAREPENLYGLKVQTKEYAPVIKAGDVFSFVLRANPVVAKKREGKENSVQHDVLMDAKKEARRNGFSEEEENQHVRKKTIGWIKNRAAKSGFSIEAGKIGFEGYRQYSFYKKNKERIKFSTVDYYGILRVEDSEAFQRSLFHGIGKKKAFGCGLLLIKPV